MSIAVRRLTTIVGVVLLSVLGPAVGVVLPILAVLLLLPALIVVSIVGACAS